MTYNIERSQLMQLAQYSLLKARIAFEKEHGPLSILEWLTVFSWHQNEYLRPILRDEHKREERKRSKAKPE